jgi:hypothetical protein
MKIFLKSVELVGRGQGKEREYFYEATSSG